MSFASNLFRCRPGRAKGRMKTAELAARMGTQRARSRTPSIESIAAVSPGAIGLRVSFREYGRFLIGLGPPVENRPHQ